MADYNTITTYNGNGTTTDFAIPFNYLNEADVVVTRQNGSVTYSFLNPNMIRLSAPLAVGDVLTIERVTDLDPAAVTFNNGSVITAGQLNAGFNQSLFAAQEANDKVNRGLFADTLNRLDAGNRRIINVATPTQANDAATKAYADSTVAAASGSATAAAASATAAATSESNAAASASSAALSAAAAATALDNFDDRYLGQKASDPTVDNDGNALIQGALYFNTVNKVMRVYDGASWIDASSAAPATMKTFTFVAAAGQTVFTGADSTGAALSFTAPFILVSVNGIQLNPATDYTTAGAGTLTLTEACSPNDEVQIVAFSAFEVANIGAADVSYSSGTAYGAGTVGNALTPRVSLLVLPSVAPAVGKSVFVTDSGREGFFVCRAGTAPSDPQQGLYVSSSTSNFYWERVWDGVHGLPEWFGAQTGNGSFDNRTALSACVALCPVTLMGSDDYWVGGLWKVNTPYRTIRGGAYGDGYNTGTGTRILSSNASAGVFQLGPDTAPPAMSNYLRNVVIENVTFGHGVSLTAPGAGNEANAVKTVRVQYVFNCRIHRVSAWEPFIGFSFYGAVRTIVSDWKVLRTMAHGGTGDFCRAVWCVGAPAIAAGGNPSLFLVDGSFECSNVLSIIKQGVYADGEFADLFIDRLETSAATTAVAINGSGSGNYGRLDLHIRDIVADQCTAAAIDIQGLNAQSLVTIDGGYVQSKSSAIAVVWLRGGAGRVSIGGGMQILCGEAGSTVGLYVNGQPNVSVDDTVSILDCPRPFTVDGGSHGGVFRAYINNPIIGDNTKYAVSLSEQSRWRLSPSIDGKTNAFAQAIFLIGTGNTSIMVDPTNVKPTVTSGNRLLLNGTGITAPGYYTSSGGAGTSGQGVHVTGITAG